MKFYTKWAPLLAISLLSAIFGYFMTKPMDKLAIFGISIGDSRENVELLTSQEFSGKVLIFVAKDGGQLQVRLGQNDEVEGINGHVPTSGVNCH